MKHKTNFLAYCFWQISGARVTAENFFLISYIFIYVYIQIYIFKKKKIMPTKKWQKKKDIQKSTNGTFVLCFRRHLNKSFNMYKTVFL